jgi:hypothetical protein
MFQFKKRIDKVEGKTTEDDYEQLFKAKSSNNNFSKFSDDDYQ